MPTELAREEALAAAAAVPGEVLRATTLGHTRRRRRRLAPFRAAGMEHVDLVNVTLLADPAGAPAPSRTRDVATGLRALG